VGEVRGVNWGGRRKHHFVGRFSSLSPLVFSDKFSVKVKVFERLEAVTSDRKGMF
jgi:hypothetical protein